LIKVNLAMQRVDINCELEINRKFAQLAYVNLPACDINERHAPVKCTASFNGAHPLLSSLPPIVTHAKILRESIEVNVQTGG